MRILQLAQFYPPILGGEERHVYNLARLLVRRGHDVSVLTLAADHNTWSVVLTTSAKDKALRALRSPEVWSAVVARYLSWAVSCS